MGGSSGGVWQRMNERARERFDKRCWGLWSKGYALGYISERTGATRSEVAGAIRRVESGRYGSPEPPPDARRGRP